MVGALSIVRFRAALKDPKDIVYMFWAISIGISSGAGIYPVAIGGTVFISIVAIVMSKRKIVLTTYLLIVTYNKEAHKDMLEMLEKLSYIVKSKTVVRGKTELTIEMKKVINTAFVDDISNINGVDSATLIKYNGDYAE